MEPKQELSRRQAIKVISAAAGGLALSLIPRGWKTPVVSVGVLPAHAQVSEPIVEPTAVPACAGDLCAVAVTSTLDVDQEFGDFDFSMCTPNGYYVWGGSSGDGATSSPDNIDFDPNVDNETLDIGAGQAVAGTYSIFLERYSELSLDMSVEIITPAGTFTNSFTLTESRAVADIVYPGGALTWRSDPGYPACGGERSKNK